LTGEVPPTDLQHREVEIVEPPIPYGLRLREYQKRAVAFFNASIDVLDASDMGLGKTIQVIAFWNIHLPEKTLIICPNSITLNWRNEFQKFGIEKREIQVVSSTSDTISGEVTIINYEKIVKMHGQLSATTWDLLVCDESHRLKNYKAKVTQHIFGRWNKDKKRWQKRNVIIDEVDKYISLAEAGHRWQAAIEDEPPMRILEQQPRLAKPHPHAELHRGSGPPYFLCKYPGHQDLACSALYPR